VVSLSVCFCLSLCLLVAFVIPAKTDEPIEIPFGWLTHVSPLNQVLDGVKVGQIHLMLRGVTRRRYSFSFIIVTYLHRIRTPCQSLKDVRGTEMSSVHFKMPDTTMTLRLMPAMCSRLTPQPLEMFACQRNTSVDSTRSID